MNQILSAKNMFISAQHPTKQENLINLENPTKQAIPTKQFPTTNNQVILQLPWVEPKNSQSRMLPVWVSDRLLCGFLTDFCVRHPRIKTNTIVWILGGLHLCAVTGC